MPHHLNGEPRLGAAFANLPNLAAEEQVLLQNQVDIGNAVKPYYGGKRARRRQIGDKTKLARAEADWFASSRQVADFLHAADPRFLSRAAPRRTMNIHLSQVIQQGVNELTGH